MHRVHCVVGALKTGSSYASETQRGGARASERCVQAKAKHPVPQAFCITVGVGM